MALGAEDVEPAKLKHAFAEFDVDATAGHVRGDRDRTLLARILDDLGLALVLLGVQDVVGNAVARQNIGEHFRRLDGHSSDEHRLTALVAFLDVFRDRFELPVARLEDLVVLVLADHRAVRRNRHHLHLVDLRELGRLGGGRAGHPGDLLVETEVVLEGDGRKRLVFLANPQPLFGLDGLVKSLGVASTFKASTRELVDDQHLAVAHDVLLVALEEGVRLEGLDKMVDKLPMDVEVQVLDADCLLDLVDAALGRGDRPLLLVDLEVHTLLEGRDDARESVVGVGGGLGDARDDQRSPGLVDQDRVGLIDDGEVVATLDAVLDANGHVVA